MIEVVKSALAEAQDALSRLRNDQDQLTKIAGAGQLLATTFRDGGKAISCGNGGSHCDAMHFAEELTGRFREDRKAIAALAISDPSHISCVANDYGYDRVFSRFIEAHGRPGDALLAISTSGKSKNIILACEVARQVGMKVVTLTGKPGSQVGQLADIDICTPGGRYADRVQELHIKVIHILLEIIEANAQ